MKKVFAMLALAFAMLACNKVQQEGLQPLGNSIPEMEAITITTKLDSKSGGTKAVAEDGNKITSTWAVDEHLAILYQAGEERKMADARITEVDATGSATIEFVVEGAENDTPCIIVYPLSAAKDDCTDVKDAAELLAVQDGTLSANLDVRVGSGTIQIAEPGLTVTAQPVALFAIFKLMLRNVDGTTALSAKSLSVTIGNQEYVIASSAATDVLYAALPAVSGEKVTFDAVDSDKRTWLFSAPSVSFTAGKYFQSTLRMREYVDMGTVTIAGEKKNLRWATCNVGADNPWDYGDYFAWGDPVPYYKPGHALDNPFDASNWKEGKTGYNWESYSWSGDDIAAALWGDPWRMPSSQDWKTLDSDLFICTWVSDYRSSGVAGLLIERNDGHCKGNQIFLPAGDIWDDYGSPNLSNPSCHYWSSTTHGERLAVLFTAHMFLGTLSYGRSEVDSCFGGSVRPVMYAKASESENESGEDVNVDGHLENEGSGGGSEEDPGENPVEGDGDDGKIVLVDESF